MNKKVVLSGMRPTGPLHLGHLAGALKNWIRLQGEYDCYYTIVTWHAFSSEYQNPQIIRQYTYEYAAGWLSVGIDPQKSVVFIQSEVKEHAELHLLLSMIIPLPWLQRVPTFKEMKQEIKDKDLNTYGFLGYPVLQTADIIIYKAHAVPVGEDQAYHVELAREITRRFNRYYGEIFPEPEILLTEVPRLAGTDGRKMSNSFKNAIYLTDSSDVIRKKISPMVTDTRRKRREDPGVPEDCPVFSLHKAFVEVKTREDLAQGCRTATIGCLECKNVVVETLIKILAPIQEKRREFDQNPQKVWNIIEKGNERARETARKTMKEVREAIGF